MGDPSEAQCLHGMEENAKTVTGVSPLPSCFSILSRRRDKNSEQSGQGQLPIFKKKFPVV